MKFNRLLSMTYFNKVCYVMHADGNALVSVLQSKRPMTGQTDWLHISPWRVVWLGYLPAYIVWTYPLFHHIHTRTEHLVSTTLLYLFSFWAFAIRICSFLTLRSHPEKSISFHVCLRLAEDTHSASALLLCCCSNLYPPHYTEAFAFSAIFYPHPIRLTLRLAYLL